VSSSCRVVNIRYPPVGVVRPLAGPSAPTYGYPMDKVFQAALVIDALLFALASEVFRRRLAHLMLPRATQPEFPSTRPRSKPNEYPFSSSRLSLMMGWVIIWTGRYREYADRQLTRYVWAARVTMLGIPAVFIAFMLTPTKI
jgi:hypothetical protein